jgi:hypothetical protein
MLMMLNWQQYLMHKEGDNWQIFEVDAFDFWEGHKDDYFP